MLCEMCSGSQASFRIDLEGAKLNVCEKCSKYGKSLGRVQVPQKPSKSSSSAVIHKKELIQIIKPDYFLLIRKARENLGLNQEEFAKKLMEKESMLHKIESGHMKPDLELARKLEKILKITIIEQVEVESGVPSHEVDKKGAGITLGDLIKFK